MTLRHASKQTGLTNLLGVKLIDDVATNPCRPFRLRATTACRFFCLNSCSSVLAFIAHPLTSCAHYILL